MPLPDEDQHLNWNAQPYKANIQLNKNKTFWWKGRLTYTDEDDVTTNIDLSDATTKKFCLESPGGVDTLIELTGLTADGKFAILVQPADIAALDASDYRYDCDIVLPVGNSTFPTGISMRIFEGIATLYGEVSA